jgi:LDH2 family malate/lactate/ureidoglycolate dehydrogenase
MPGEIEARTKKQRLAEGIELDDITWKSLCDCAKSLGVAVG